MQVLGNNLLALIKAYNYKGIPLHLVKRITQQACSLAAIACHDPYNQTSAVGCAGAERP